MSLRHVAALERHTERVWSAQFDHTGERIVTCSSDKTCLIWQKKNKVWTPTDVLKYGHQRTIRWASFSPCGNYIVTASFDSTAIVWKHEDNDWEQLQTLEGHEHEIKCAEWSPSGRFLATCSRDKSVWLWEVDEDGDLQCSAIMQSHNADVKSVAWQQKEDVLASCSYDNSFRTYVYDVEDDWILASKVDDAHFNTVWQCCFDDTGTHLFTVGADALLKVWRLHKDKTKALGEQDTWHVVCTVDASEHAHEVIYTVDYCSQLQCLATGAADNGVRIFRVYNLTSGNPSIEKVACVVDVHTDEVNTVRWSPTDIGTLVTASDDKTARIWRFEL